MGTHILCCRSCSPSSFFFFFFPFSEHMFSEGSDRSELSALRKDLCGSDNERVARTAKLTALRTILSAMTSGKDVSSLFPEVQNNMQSEHLEVKKLVYLYLMHTAEEEPDVVIMSVNSFVKDLQDNNPLIRALAL